jgi:hypothetical protein
VFGESKGSMHQLLSELREKNEEPGQLFEKELNSVKVVRSSSLSFKLHRVWRTLSAILKSLNFFFPVWRGCVFK